MNQIAFNGEVHAVITGLLNQLFTWNDLIIHSVSEPLPLSNSRIQKTPLRPFW